MAGLYVYGFTSRPVAPALRGLFRRPLRSIAMGDCAAVVEDAGRAPRPTVRHLRAQSRVIGALVARGVDVLPTRFGAFVMDRAALRRAVDRQRPDLIRALRRVKGRVQMTVHVRVHAPTPDAGNTGGGAAYLRARASRARQPRRDPLVQAVQRAARPFVRESRLEWQDGDPAIARVHHLVPRSRVSRYQEAVMRAVRARGTEAVVSGPWAPFAFAEVA